MADDPRRIGAARETNGGNLPGPLGFKGMLQQIGTEIRNGAAFVIGTTQQRLMHGMAQADGDAPRMTLQD